jgi:hypothetical protein
MLHRATLTTFKAPRFISPRFFVGRRNWTSSAQGAAMLGHSDRIGLHGDASKSWNSTHPSSGPEGGCSQADLRSTGGDGLMYCFAVN